MYFKNKKINKIIIFMFGAISISLFLFVLFRLKSFKYISRDKILNIFLIFTYYFGQALIVDTIISLYFQNTLIKRKEKLEKLGFKSLNQLNLKELYKGNLYTNYLLFGVFKVLNLFIFLLASILSTMFFHLILPVLTTIFLYIFLFVNIADLKESNKKYKIRNEEIIDFYFKYLREFLNNNNLMKSEEFQTFLNQIKKDINETKQKSFKRNKEKYLELNRTMIRVCEFIENINNNNNFNQEEVHKKLKEIIVK